MTQDTHNIERVQSTGGENIAMDDKAVESDVHADQGFDIVESAETITVSEEDSTIVRRKLDLHLLPLMCAIYGLCYVDKACMGWAVLFNFRQDLHLVGDQYSWAGAAFYFGFLVAQYPVNYFLQRYKTGKILGYSTILWGILMVAHLGVRNFAGLMVVRTLLGIIESSVMPAFVLYTSVFYTRKEQVWRTLLWSAMQGLFTIFGSLLSYGLGHITDTLLKPWMYIFLVLGLLSLITGVLWLIFMPETPNAARFLTEEQRRMAVLRVAANMTGIKGYDWKTYQIWHALKDPKVWLLLFYKFFCSVPNGGLTNFGSLVISGIGFGSFNTLLLQLPSSVVSAGSMILWGLFSMRYSNLRTLGMVIPLLVAIAGMAAVYATQDTGANRYGRVVAYWLINSYAVTTPFSLAIVGQNIAGHTKRATTNTLLFLSYAAGNIAGPFFFRSQDAPKYVLAITVILISLSLSCASALALRIVMILENRRRDRIYGTNENTDGRLQGMRMGMLDKTDNENVDFRYVL